ncbi:MAG: hemagglutinin repeat-containing protein, partial [Acetobacter orientalis]
MTVGGNATLAALSGDLKTAGTSLTSNGSMILSSAKTLDLGSVTNSQSVSVSGSKKGFLTHSNFSNSQSSSTDIGTTLAAGEDLTAVSGHDMHIAGLVGGGGNVTLLSGGAFTESALHSTASESASHHVAGFHMSTQGASGTVGYGSRTDAQSVQSSTYTPSVVASTGGSLNISAKGAVTLDASTVSAAKDLSISGSSVAFKAEQNSVDQSAYHRDKSIGFTARVSPNSVVGQIINTALAATKTSGKGSGALKVMDAMQAGYLAGSGINQARDNAGTLFDTNEAHRSSDNLELAGIQAGVGLASNRRSAVQTESSVQGASALAGGTLSVVARGDSPADGHNGGISAVAAQLAGQNIVLAAQKDITLLAGWDKTHTESRMSSNNAFVGAEASIGTTGAGISVTASVDRQTQHVVSSSATAVDTTLTATQGIAITTPEAVRLNGAEVSGPRIDVSAGSLEITSPQNTYEYKSSATQSGMSISVPVWGAGGDASGSASYTRQNTTDHFASTEQQLSGFYAGSKGLGVDVAGPTTLTAGVLSSTADASLNHFNTGSLSATGVSNVSGWQATQTGFSFSSGAGMGSTAGILGSIGTGLAAGASGMVGAGRAQQERSESVSAISGSIAVHAGSRSGSYTTDVSAADKALVNQFDAQKLSNQLQGQQIGSQLVGEVGGQISDRLDSSGVPGFATKDGSNAYGRIGLEAAGNALVAAVTGGNPGAVAASTAAGDFASIATRQWAQSVASSLTSDRTAQKALANVLSNSIAAAAGGAVGAASGGKNSSITALNGAASASAIQQFNEAAEKDEK